MRISSHALSNINVQIERKNKFYEYLRSLKSKVSTRIQPINTGTGEMKLFKHTKDNDKTDNWQHY